MITWTDTWLLLLASLLLTTATADTATFAIKRDIVDGTETSDPFTAQIVGRLGDDGDYEGICGDDDYSDDNLEIICIFYGYGTYEQVTDVSNLTLNETYTEQYGFSEIDCEDAANTWSCGYSETGVNDTDCSRALVVICSDKWEITAATTSTLILPIFLCIATVALILLMCLKDVQEKKKKRLSSMKIRHSQKERWAANRILSALSKSRGNEEGNKKEGKKSGNSAGIRDNKVDGGEEPKKYDV